MSAFRPPVDAVLIDQPGRCGAMVKWIWHYRCTRSAVTDGLCKQHGTLGATIPSDWKHWHNDLGVVCCEPIPPFHRHP